MTPVEGTTSEGSPAGGTAGGSTAGGSTAGGSTAGGWDAPSQLTLIVDGANVMGSRANGWWRDRAGAMARLHDELVALAARGITSPPPGDDPRPGDGTPPGADASEPWFPEILLVVEGKSGAVVRLVTADPRVRIIPAPGEGDDEITRLAGSVEGRRVVVTADQELRRRCRRAGAEVTGPRWLTGLLR